MIPTVSYSGALAPVVAPPADAGALLGAAMDAPPEVLRNKILTLQDAMLQATEHHIECEVKHIFAPGLYARQMLIPKGTVIVGKIHKHAHVNTISQGSCSVLTEFGPMTITAPHTFVSEPGTKRAVVALEDVIWTTYHPTDETDLEKIEAHVIAKSYDELALPTTETRKLKE